jgi:hypothetical protein
MTRDNLVTNGCPVSGMMTPNADAAHSHHTASLIRINERDHRTKGGIDRITVAAGNDGLNPRTCIEASISAREDKASRMTARFAQGGNANVIE